MKRLLLFLLVLFLLAAAMAAYLVQTTLKPSSMPFNDRATATANMTADYPGLAQWLDSLAQHNALRDTIIVNAEQQRLHAFYVRSPRADESRAALLVHGYTDSAIRMMHLARMYHRDLGLNVLIPDLRFHGQSEGTHIGMGYADRSDLHRWVGVGEGLFATPAHPKAALVVHGVSMGGAATMMLGGDAELSPQVKALVDDCGYTSVRDVFAHQMWEQYRLPAFPVLYLASGITRLRFGWTFAEASPLEAVKRCTRPMLFIHGERDTYVPTAMVHQLYAAKPAPRRLWIAPGSEHALSYHDHPAAYTQQVRNFVQTYLP
ncbi:MAG: alpha/beta hydrolase [Bacteroidaceae bacterium]|nr:alpha/beta hydrolase [Bacteroidaceae bacterium]